MGITVEEVKELLRQWFQDIPTNVSCFYAWTLSDVTGDSAQYSLQNFYDVPDAMLQYLEDHPNDTTRSPVRPWKVNPVERKLHDEQIGDERGLFMGLSTLLGRYSF
jgi:hypothetical protein